MEELKLLEKTVNVHAQHEGIVMTGQAVYNFADHINPEVGGCEECLNAFNAYNEGAIKIIITTEPV